LLKDFLNMGFRNEWYYFLAFVLSLILFGVPFLFRRKKRKKNKNRDFSPDLLLERKKFIHSLVFPCFFLFLIWFVKMTELGLETDFAQFGIFPRELKGITGIITAPLVHDDFRHLIDNSVPVFVLSLAIFYFYREIAYKIFFIIYFVTGFLVWIAGREAYHIGASGLIYGFASFLFLSGVIRQNVNLLAISLLVTFLYGSMIWGILPYDYQISWESHLMGALTGIVVSIIYRDMGPERVKYSWEEEEQEDNHMEQLPDSHEESKEK
jgi:membrane associated rhomboid family serine protease